MTARYIVGDVLDTLATLEPSSVDLVLTSPPFLALRSYLPASHPDKLREIGSEATPADFIDTLLDVVEACDRVLAPHGSICVELGDSYSGGSAEGTDARNEDRGEWTKYRGRSNGCDITKTGAGWPLDKSLCGIPQLFMLSLAYGRNMLRPERQTPRWRVRNVVAWCRPNPPVGALADKFRPATSYLTVACKSRSRYFDLDAVRTPTDNGWTDRDGARRKAAGRSHNKSKCPAHAHGEKTTRRVRHRWTGGTSPPNHTPAPTTPPGPNNYASPPSGRCAPKRCAPCAGSHPEGSLKSNLRHTKDRRPGCSQWGTVGRRSNRRTPHRRTHCADGRLVGLRPRPMAPRPRLRPVRRLRHHPASRHRPRPVSFRHRPRPGQR